MDRIDRKAKEDLGATDENLEEARKTTAEMRDTMVDIAKLFNKINNRFSIHFSYIVFRLIEELSRKNLLENRAIAEKNGLENHPYKEGHIRDVAEDLMKSYYYKFEDSSESEENG